MDDATLRRLRQEWKVEQVYETTGIEGNTLDINETRLVLERGVTLTGKPSRDQVDATNMQAALEYLERLADDETPLTARDVREIQSIVVGRDDPSAGRFRSGEVRIAQSEHIPPPASEVDAQVDEALSWLQRARDCPPPIKASVIHAWLAHIHPFGDGNGRTARAVMNLVLIRDGYPIVLIRRKDRTRYYDALAASDNGDIGPLVDLMVKRALDSLRQIIRVRAEATGLTEAIRQAEEGFQAEYAVWHQSMLLLLRSIEAAAERVYEQSSGNIAIRVREYDQVTADDYRALLRRDASGNGWLAVLRGRGYTKASELLLWNGYRSSDLARLAKVEERGGSVFFSELDPERVNGPFRRLESDSSFNVREVGFEKGAYVALTQARHQSPRPKRMRSDELASLILSSFIRTYLT